MAEQEKRAKVILGIETETSQAEQELQRLLQVAAETDQAIKEIRKESGGIWGELQEMFKDGMLKGLGELGAAVGITGGGMYTIATQLTSAMKLLGDESLTSLQKLDAFVKGMPGVGKLYTGAQGLGNELFYADDIKALRRNRSALAYDRDFNAIRDSGEARIQDLRSQMGGSAVDAQLMQQFAQDQMAGQSANVLGGGLMAGGRDPRMTAALEARARADMALKSAQARMSDQAGDRSRTQDELRVLEQFRDSLATPPKPQITSLRKRTYTDLGMFGGRDEDGFYGQSQGDNKNRFTQIQQMDELRRATEQADAKRNELMQREEQYRASAAEYQRREYELAKADLDVRRARLSIVQSEEEALRVKEQRAQAGAQQFNQSDAWGQLDLVNTVKRFQNVGYGALTAGERDVLSRNTLTAPLVARGAQQFAKQNPLFQELNALLGEQGIEEIRRELGGKIDERLKLEGDLKTQAIELEARFSKAMSDEFSKFADKMIEAIQTAMRAAQDRIKLDEKAKVLERSGE